MSAIVHQQRPCFPPILEVPAGAQRNEQGYVIEVPKICDESTWQGRLIKRMDNSLLESHELQRSLGYKVYEGDPGKETYEMNDVERYQVGLTTTKWMCTLL